MSADDGHAIALTVSTPAWADRPFHAEPMTIGVPFPQGLVPDAARIGLVDGDGRAVPVQAQPTERWPDGSVRWALVDFQATGEAADRRAYRLRTDGGAVVRSSPRLTMTQASGRIVVDTGTARFEIGPGVSFPFTGVTVDGDPAVDPSATALRFTDVRGRSRPARITRVELEEVGDLRSSVRLEAIVGPRRRPTLQVIARVHFFAGSSATRVAITCRNQRRAGHAGGFWELGDRGSVRMQDVSLHIALATAATGIQFAPDTGSRFEHAGGSLELYQASSGGAHGRQPNPPNRHDEAPSVSPGYRMRAGEIVSDGPRATPAVTLTHASGSASMAIEYFWQNFPKAIEADARGITLRLWPHQCAGHHELQGGEQKTHVLVIAFGADPIARDALFWGRAPSVAALPPQWYADSGAIRHMRPASEDRDGRYRQLVNLAIEGDDTFERKREAIDEYGWRNFGDLYADHENAFTPAPRPIVSHYNNQYDAVAGLALQFMRTGDVRWWRVMAELATHVTDIDVYHTDRDKAAYNHGLFWHTCHYVPAGRSTHRSYPRHPGVCGGGPASEHNYAAGLRLHWLLTGDRLSRDAAIGLARWVVDMDDGRKTILRWLTASATGLASATYSPDFHGPGRGAGHSILALLEGYRLTGERTFLAKAEELIRRCVHPADDIAALDLLDAERRWSYTVFLQALGKYLDDKAELGELDPAYAYGRASLLHYARWMAAHEYPYLDKPERLEFPTETWAAQDMRKCEVFTIAAQHTTGPERDRFINRAGFFFEYSVSTLVATESRSLTRPLVLLLSNGFRHAALQARLEPPPASPALASEGMPTAFRPQKAIAKRRLVLAGAAAALAAVIFVIACLAIR